MPSPKWMLEELAAEIQAGFAVIGAHSYGRPVLRFPGLGQKFICGKYCSFASSVQIFLGGNHRSDWTSSYPFPAFTGAFPAARGIRDFHVGRGDVVVGNDVWCGWAATIASGVTVGDGAVIATQSLVSRDVPPYAIVGGNPAQIIRYRFDDQTIHELLALKWWDWDEAKINENVDLLCGDPRRLIDRHLR